MIKLLKKAATKNGEVLTPFLILGKKVYCYNASGKTVIKEINDFVETPTLSENIITPEIYNTDELYDETTNEEIKPERTPQKSTEKIITNEDNNENYI